METTQAKDGITQPKKAVERAYPKIEGEEIALRERIEQARDLIDELRDRAEMAIHERPYLLPVATGAIGLGVGVLIGSKLSRVLLFTAAGALLSETVRGQVARISRDFIRDIGVKTSSSEEGEDIEAAEPG